MQNSHEQADSTAAGQTPIRVCMVSFYFHPEYSGSAVQAANLCRHLRDCGIRSFVVSARLSAWPGNVRELINTIHYAFVTCKGDTIEPDNLPEQIVKYVLFDEKNAYTVDDIKEKVQIESALEMAGGKMIKAAKILGYSRVTLWKKVKQFNIDRISF